MVGLLSFAGGVGQGMSNMANKWMDAEIQQKRDELLNEYATNQANTTYARQVALAQMGDKSAQERDDSSYARDVALRQMQNQFSKEQSDTGYQRDLALERMRQGGQNTRSQAAINAQLEAAKQRGIKPDNKLEMQYRKDYAALLKAYPDPMDRDVAIVELNRLYGIGQSQVNDPILNLLQEKYPDEKLKSAPASPGPTVPKPEVPKPKPQVNSMSLQDIRSSLVNQHRGNTGRNLTVQPANNIDMTLLNESLKGLKGSPGRRK